MHRKFTGAFYVLVHRRREAYKWGIVLYVVTFSKPW